MNTLKKKGPSETFFRDQKDVGEMNFMFADKRDGIDEAVSLTRKLPIMKGTIVTELIRSRFITDVFAPAKIQQFLIELSNPKNCNVFLRSKTFEGQTN